MKQSHVRWVISFTGLLLLISMQINIAAFNMQLSAMIETSKISMDAFKSLVLSSSSIWPAMTFSFYLQLCIAVLLVTAPLWMRQSTPKLLAA